MYQEQAWVNPLAGSIAELLLRRGDVQAHALQQAAAARAQAAGSIGDIVVGLPRQIQAQRVAQQEAQIRAAQIAATQHEAALQPVHDAMLARQIASQNAAEQEGRPAADFGEAGPPTVTIPGVSATAFTPQIPSFTRRPRTAEEIAAIQRAADLEKERIKAVGGTYKPGEVNPLLGDQPPAGPAQPKTEAEFALDAANPQSPTRDQSRAALDLMRANKGDYTINGQRFHRDGTPVGGPVPPQATPANAETIRHNRATEATAAATAARMAGDVTELTAAGLDAAALAYAKTGLLPPLGNGDKTTRKRIINRAAEMMPGLDVASARADFTANQDSLKKLQGQRDAMGAFESTALKNLDVFLEAAKKVTDTGSPFLNRPLRAIDERVLGAPAMTAFQTARRTVIPEFAKILANPGLSGQLSDSARKEVEDVVHGDATLPQIAAAARVLQTDVRNRTSAYDDQIAGIKARIAKAQAPEPTRNESNVPRATEGATQPIPGVPGGEATFRNGRWIRTK